MDQSCPIRFLYIEWSVRLTQHGIFLGRTGPIRLGWVTVLPYGPGWAHHDVGLGDARFSHVRSSISTSTWVGMHGIYHLHVYFLMLPESYFPDARFKINVPATVIDLRSSYPPWFSVPIRPVQAQVSTSYNFTSMYIYIYIFIREHALHIVVKTRFMSPASSSI